MSESERLEQTRHQKPVNDLVTGVDGIPRGIGDSKEPRAIRNETGLGKQKPNLSEMLGSKRVPKSNMFTCNLIMLK